MKVPVILKDEVTVQLHIKIVSFILYLNKQNELQILISWDDYHWRKIYHIIELINFAEKIPLKGLVGRIYIM